VSSTETEVSGRTERRDVRYSDSRENEIRINNKF